MVFRYVRRGLPSRYIGARKNLRGRGDSPTHIAIPNFVADHATYLSMSDTGPMNCLLSEEACRGGNGTNALSTSNESNADMTRSGTTVGPMGDHTSDMS